MPENAEPDVPALRDQFASFETTSRPEFDNNGWSVFSEKINEYVNDLYTGTRRECISRANNNERVLRYSGKDVERATLRLDYQRYFGQKRQKYMLQIGGAVGALLTGIMGSWVFDSVIKKTASPNSIILLLVIFFVTIYLYFLSYIKDMEP